MKRRVAVFLGGRSPEHDISVLSGLQALNALDQDRFDAFVVYVSRRGQWFIGEPLRQRQSYIPDERDNTLTEVTLDVGARTVGRLLPKRSGLFARAKPVEFDVALLAFHGVGGEDGQMQGLLESANIPYTGMRTMASALLMDKVATKQILAGRGIALLPAAVIDRPASGTMIALEELTKAVGGIKPPWCVKPVHLGSSIGVAKVGGNEDLRAVLPTIFRLDSQAMIEPFVPNLVEYNVAVASVKGEIRTSAIERPKRTAELLDFREKYLSGGGKKGGSKSPGESSQGMLSLTRDISPTLPPDMERKIRDWASEAFRVVGGTGSPRADFLCDESTGELWLNELNPCPGSFAYFLWAAADPPVLFSALLSRLVDEAIELHQRSQLPDDPVPVDARILTRR
jgi:D-alanine-D-alanine ligase